MAGVYEVGTENGKFLSGDSDILVGHVEVIVDKGFRNEVSGLETDSIDLESATAKDCQVKGVNGEVNIKSETNGNHLEVEKVNGSENVVGETIDLDSGKITNTDCSLIPTETSQPLEDSKSQDTASRFLLSTTNVIKTVQDTLSPDYATQMTNETEQFETEAIDDQIRDETTISQLVEVSVDKTQTNTQQPATEYGKSENKNGDILLEKHGVPQVTEHQRVDVLDDKQNEFEVKKPILIFPDTFECPEIKFQFGSFGVHEKDPNNLNLVLEVLNREAEPIRGVNINTPDTILDDLQNKSADKATHCMNDVVQPYNRVPRFDDEELKEQIKNAQLQLDEKIRCRYAIWAEIQENRAILKADNEALKNAYLEVTAAKKLRKSKRSDLESILHLMKQVRKAEDIDNSHMHKVEHMIEIQNQKKKIKELLNNIAEEVDSLKDSVLKAEVAALVIGKIYDEEYEKGKELRARFHVAEEVCQQAYTHLYSLKKRLYDKKKLFYMYKEDATAARNCASGGDKVALHHPCVNQVEKIMEESNSNEEFRKDYISRTTPSTLVETSLESHMNERIAVKEVPISSKLEPTSVISKVEQGKKTVSCVSDICERIATNSVSISSETESVSLVSKVEQRKKTTSTPENQTIWKVARKTNRIMKTTKPVKFVVRDSKFICLSEITEDEEMEKTMVEVDKKEDELSKKEIECNLKEQVRLEEKRKMNEAIERKTRNAENAQKRAELRAQREAEQRQKVREKRLRRKERKRTVGDNKVNDEKIVANETEKPRAATLTVGDRRQYPQLWKMVDS
ncbi:unnamed protein product [Lactuca virosa]|uniref:Uncharacterized protein n=1 Tax=Lactuca virosa TaxID=75947 RepID=A0AAU9P974_9ASTR|nr:unnamed protein product [Lactuca virosa]